MTDSANHSEIVRTKVRGEPDTLIAGDDWREDAACRYPTGDLTLDDWFTRLHTLPGRDSARRAKAVCAECPVKEACLAYAIETRQPFGVWGGKTADERGIGYRTPKAKPDCGSLTPTRRRSAPERQT